ncbi:MAG TPA: hypothetical protein VHH36_08705 [Candidatus Thermoplasmatota archaeon]|nr:hypothetical protein [Candidatus Thermoplasmatota archaeon]
MEELLERPTAIRVLYALGKKESLNVRQFVEASRHGRPVAVKIRDELERLGYIQIRDIGGHGNAGEMEITLTTFGKRVVEHLVAIADIVEKQRASQR